MSDALLGPSTRSKQLLSQLASKELGEKEFLLECAYWSLKEGFDELKPRTIPTKPPKATELEIKYKDKEDVDWTKIFNDYPEVKGYYELERQVKHWNLGTMGWLEELLRIIPEGDFISRDKVTKKLNVFKELYGDSKEVQKIKETFDAKSS